MQRVRLRFALPGVMLVILFGMLHVARQEATQWIARRAQPPRVMPGASPDETAGSWSFPFEYSEKVRDLISFQWPVFVVANLAVPVPLMFRSRTGPNPFTTGTYFALSAGVFAYWSVIGMWLDWRVIGRRTPRHSRFIGALLWSLVVPTGLFFILFLGKDILSGWPEGGEGAWGLTAWLGMLQTILLFELDVPGRLVRHRHP